MSKRWIALIIWGIIVLAGLVILSARLGERSERMTAAQQMPVNHLIHAGDFRDAGSGELAGMYLRMNIVEGEIVTRRDVSPTPLLGVDLDPWFAVPIPGAAARRSGIDPKSKGQICDQADVLAAAEVVALFCPESDETRSCMVLVRVAPADATKLAGALAGKPAVDRLIFKPACNK